MNNMQSRKLRLKFGGDAAFLVPTLLASIYVVLYIVEVDFIIYVTKIALPFFRWICWVFPGLSYRLSVIEAQGFGESIPFMTTIYGMCVLLSVSFVIINIIFNMKSFDERILLLKNINIIDKNFPIIFALIIYLYLSVFRGMFDAGMYYEYMLSGHKYSISSIVEFAFMNFSITTILMYLVVYVRYIYLFIAKKV
ncbi:MAG: hypothetical protein NUV50_05640 [Rhodospirillales bacterium]|nr:hypothetical protein [Rhodospirillales bacterium]